MIWTESKLDKWYMRFLYKPMSHVYAMKKSPGGNFWIIVNHAISGTRIMMESITEYPHPRVYAGINAVILKIETHIDNKKQQSWLCFFSCVDVVKSLLGIKNALVFTPYQLYKYLISQKER